MSLLVPGPGGADDGRKIGMRGCEIQHRACRADVRDQIGWIARPARFDHMRHSVAGLIGDRVEDFTNRIARAGAEIEGAAGMALQQKFQRGDMRRSEIGDVDVVADRGAVGRIVVVAEHREIG